MDAAEAGRIILLVILLIVVTQWSVKNPVFVLRAFLVGLVASTFLNLIFTFRENTRMIGVLPALMGQNGPGTSMGIGACLSAWLVLISKRRIDFILAVVGVLAFCFGAGISYSKIGMGAALAGICCMAAVIVFKPRRTGGRYLRGLAILVCSSISIYVGTAHGSAVIESLNRFIYLKSNTLTLTTNQSEQSASNQARSSYYLGVGELMLAHPLDILDFTMHSHLQIVISTAAMPQVKIRTGVPKGFRIRIPPCFTTRQPGDSSEAGSAF